MSAASVYATTCDNCKGHGCHKCDETGLIYRVNGYSHDKQWPGTERGERAANTFVSLNAPALERVR